MKKVLEQEEESSLEGLGWIRTAANFLSSCVDEFLNPIPSFLCFLTVSLLSKAPSSWLLTLFSHMSHGTPSLTQSLPCLFLPFDAVKESLSLNMAPWPIFMLEKNWGHSTSYTLLVFSLKDAGGCHTALCQKIRIWHKRLGRAWKKRPYQVLPLWSHTLFCPLTLLY